MSSSLTSRTTRSASRKRATNAVLYTTELLENILEFLPVQDLLLAQRVSQKWKAVINKSKTLQQTLVLFLVPKPPDFLWMLERRHTNPTPKWPKRVPCTQTLPDSLPAGIEQLALFQNSQLNPLIFITEEIDIYQRAELSGGTEVQLRKRIHGPAMKYPEASWRKMYIKQPPDRDCSYWGYMDPGDDDDEGGYMYFDGDVFAQHPLRVEELFASMESYGFQLERINSLGLDVHSWSAENPVKGSLYPLEHQMTTMLAEQDQLVEKGPSAAYAS